MTSGLQSIFNSGLELLFPPQCTLCQREMESLTSGPQLCGQCRALLLAGGAFRCPRCAGSIPAAPRAGETCVHCRASRFHFTHTVAIGPYRGALQQAVLTMKRPESTSLTLALAELLWETRGSELQALAADCIVPIPMHWWRRCMRGVNSPELLAEVLGRRLGRPVHRSLLRRARPPQGSLTPARRRINLRNAMRARNLRKLNGLRVLVVDDVLTTGATCSEAARALCAAGAAQVVATVLARGEGEE